VRQNGAVTDLHPTAQRLRERLAEAGLDVEVRELDRSTRTAGDAAAAVGCELAQIVKSLVFVVDGEPLLCLCSGDRRVDTAALGEDVRQATAAEVREATGFAIGGVPPAGHERPMRTVVDAGLRRFDIVWCAAGTPNALFAVHTDALLRALPQAEIRDVAA
jgi:prolyl-tRNA editing enzyme YbaK/EbsC (Cys-tRNA(Pro) deacylase)